MEDGEVICKGGWLYADTNLAIACFAAYDQICSVPLCGSNGIYKNIKFVEAPRYVG
jgi:hypothetical protein